MTCVTEPCLISLVIAAYTWNVALRIQILCQILYNFEDICKIASNGNFHITILYSNILYYTVIYYTVIYYTIQ